MIERLAGRQCLQRESRALRSEAWEDPCVSGGRRQRSRSGHGREGKDENLTVMPQCQFRVFIKTGRNTNDTENQSTLQEIVYRLMHLSDIFM